MNVIHLAIIHHHQIYHHLKFQIFYLFSYHMEIILYPINLMSMTRYCQAPNDQYFI